MDTLFPVTHGRMDIQSGEVNIIIDSYELDLVTPIRHYFSQ